MKTSWLIGLAMIYVTLTVVSGISEGTYFGGTGIETIWDAMTGIKTIEVSNPVTAIIEILMDVGRIFQGLFEIFTWKFSFFVGVWAIFRWLLFAISLGIMMSFALAIRGTSSG